MNLACGTGDLIGSETTTGVAVLFGDGPENQSVSYGIVYVAGIGVLAGTATDGDPVDGVIVLTPTGGNCVSGVTGFEISGVGGVAN